MFLVELPALQGMRQSGDTAGLPTGSTLWAGLSLQAASLKSMPTMQLSTEVPLFSY